jgi:molybdenum cofactor synthesis domain-containing protein
VDERALACLVLVVSDRRAAGTAVDGAGPLLRSEVVAVWPNARVAISIVPDERPVIADAIRGASTAGTALVLTSGGTGLAERDVTPEATRDVLERFAPGLVHAMLSAGIASTPKAMLGRPEAGTLGRTLVVNLPGNPKGAVDSLRAILPVLPHAIDVLSGEPGAEKGHSA